MNQNQEVKEHPQWVVDILNRLDRLENKMNELKFDVELVEYFSNEREH